MGKGPEPVPIRIISRIDGKDLGQDGGVMGTLRFAHPTGLVNLTGWWWDGHAALCPSYGVAESDGMAV
jgi:hypothetical protein